VTTTTEAERVALRRSRPLVGLFSLFLAASCNVQSTPVDPGRGGLANGPAAGSGPDGGAGDGTSRPGIASSSMSSGSAPPSDANSGSSGSGGPQGVPRGTGSSSGGTNGAASSAGSGTAASGSSCGATTASAGAGSEGATDTGASCPVTASAVRVTEIDVGMSYIYQETDAAGGDNIGLAPLQIAPIPSGGSRVAFMGKDGMVHIAQLDAGDQLVSGSVFGMPAFDMQDVYADDSGGVVLVSRNATGGGTGNCGTPSNLCGIPPNPPDPCWDMYMVRFDGCGHETWATKLTTSSASLPPYSTGPTGLQVFMIWWYAHNGRIAFDPTNNHYAGYYGAAISVSQGGCINIHQGDEMRVVDTSGNIVSGGFDWGCSHSAFERMTWDGTKFVTVCNNDADPGGNKTGRMAFAPASATIYPVNELNAELGAVIKAGAGGYWLVLSDVRPGQPTTAPALDDVHLVHTTTGAADSDITLASDTGLNDRAPHLAAFGKNRMLAAWETSTKTDHLLQTDTSRRLYLQALDDTTGAAQGAAYYVPGVTGSRYQDFRTYSDGSVAYVAPGSSASKIRILRVFPCK